MLAQSGEQRASTLSTPDQAERRALLPIFLIVVVDVLGMTIILPLLPFYAQEFGASPRQIGLLIATYADEDSLDRGHVFMTDPRGGNTRYATAPFHQQEGGTALVCSVTPTQVFAFAKGNFGQTRHRF